MRRPKNVWDQKRGIWQPRISEEMVLREIVERLWLQAKIKVWRINCPVGGKVRPNEVGIPDLVGVIPRCWSPWVAEKRYARTGVGLWIEVKRPGGARRPAQERTIQELKEAGAVAFFGESWADVVKELAQVGIILQEGFDEGEGKVV